MHYLAIAAVAFPLAVFAFYWFRSPIEDGEDVTSMLFLAAVVTLMIVIVCWGSDYLEKEKESRKGEAVSSTNFTRFYASSPTDSFDVVVISDLIETNSTGEIVIRPKQK